VNWAISPTHVYPLTDLREHDLTADCWCRPETKEYSDRAGLVVVHNSMDGREAFERGERKPS